MPFIGVEQPNLYIYNTLMQSQSKKPKPSKDRRQSTQLLLLQGQSSQSFSIVQIDQEQLHALNMAQWQHVLQARSFLGFSSARIHFSFLKGIPLRFRWQIWLMLAEIDLIPSPSNYMKLLKDAKDTKQIDVDVSRTFQTKQLQEKYGPALKRILHATNSLKIEYIQGMNYIVASLLAACCDSLAISQRVVDNVIIEEQILKVFMWIVKELNQAFGSDREGIFTLIKQLDRLICERIPQIMYHIAKLDLDSMTLFNQNYFCLMLYSNPPRSFADFMFDLFFLEGKKTIGMLIVKMLQLCSEQIIRIKSSYELMKFMKRDIFNTCAQRLENERNKATTFDDFGISFYSAQKL